MRKISLNEKLVVYFVMIGVLGVLIVSAFAYYNSRQALLNRTFDQLTSVRVNKKKQVEAFFQDRLHDVSLMAATDEISKLSKKMKYSSSSSLPLEIDTPGIKEFLYAYLGSSKYFRRMILLNDSGAGIVLSLPDVDHFTFFSNFNQNQFLSGGLTANAFEKDVKIHDIISNPETMQPTLLISSPVIGSRGQYVVVLEVFLSEISRIMLENNAEDGLGESGESYIVGADTLMRSQSRFQHQSVLKTKVNTRGFREAMEGKSGIAIIDDYRGISVLSSYGPLNIPGLDWVMLAEIDAAEAMSPVNVLRSRLLIIGLFNLILIFGFAFFLSRRITSPILRLNKAAANIGTGSLDVNLPIKSNDEIGELTETFNKMALQLKEQQDDLAEERKMRLRSMIDGQEKERQRLSRDLHDGLGQSLIAIKLQLENFCDGLDKGQNEKMEKIKQYFEQTIEDIRRMSNDLAPSVLDEFGLSTAIRHLCRNFSDQSGMVINFESSGHNPNVSKKTRIYLFRICQEALSNAIKHAQARQIDVSLSLEEHKISLQIKDDGMGFNLENAKQCHGNGINNIYERTQLLHGFAQIITDPGKGTRVRIECKLKN
ncbi:MAG: sensor histidine kinase [Bacteroidales bacterium]|nr:sensor histidine kinase [Bacteroidales bacterium]